MNRLAGLLLGLLLLPGVLHAEDKPATDAAPNYYPLKQGNKWTHRLLVGDQQRGTIVSEVTATETVDGKELAKLEASVNGQVLASEHLQVTPEGVLRHKFNGMEVTPPVLLLKYPVKDGDKWEIKTAAGGDKLNGTATVTLEDVKVVAGEYKKAVKVMLDFTIENTQQQVKTTYWFADGIGMVKQDLNAGNLKVIQELEKFEAAK